MISRLHF